MCFTFTLILAFVQSPDSNQPTGMSLVGTVVTPAGDPVEAADLWLSVNHVDDGELPLFARAKSDGRGRFALPVPESWLQQPNPPWLIVWAFRPGGLLATPGIIAPESLLSANPLRIVIEPPADSRIKLLGSDGRAVAGARVALRSLVRDNFGIYVVDEVAERTAVKSDADGIAAVGTVPREEISIIRIATNEWGTQEAAGWGRSLQDEVRLRATGRVRGRLVADDPEAVRGATVELSTYEPFTPDSMKSRITGVARVRTDDDGRFDVPAIAEGNLGFRVRPRDGVPYRLDPRRAGEPPVVRAGELTEVELPLKKLVRVRGEVRELATGKPIAGALVRVAMQAQREYPTTGADGRFEFFGPPGPLSLWAVVPPKPFVPVRNPGGGRNAIPDGGDEFTLPPISVHRGVELRGSVVDDEGKPVANAAVQASSGESPRGAITLTNDRGEFVLSGVDARAEVQVEANRGGVRAAPLALTRIDPAEPITLRISPAYSSSLRGRVVDVAGKPLAGATLQVWYRRRTPDGWSNSEFILYVDGQRFVRSDDDGRFDTRRTLDPESSYRVVALADGVLAGKTDWVTGSGPEELALPDLVVRRLRTVSGRVLDGDGRPVPDATVLSSGDSVERVRVTNDADGRFRIPGVFEGPAFLFVEKEGFRFQGQQLDPFASTVDLVIGRRDEPPIAARHPRRDPPDRKNELDTARRIIEPYLARLMESDDHRTKAMLLGVLARIDPHRVLDQLAADPLPHPRLNDDVRSAVVRSLIREAADESLAIVESMQEPASRVQGYLDVFDFGPATDPARRLELLAQAQVHVRSIGDPTLRVFRLAGVANRLLDAGEKDRAVRLLDEARSLVQEMSGDRAKGCRAVLSSPLARVDLDGALEMIKDLDRHTFADSHGRTARRIADVRPDESERILNLLEEEFYRDRWTGHVCARMARADLDRAKRLADSIRSPAGKALARGMMAESLAKTDPAAASELLAEAFQLLSADADRTANQVATSYHYVVAVAASLLPVAEAVDPQLVPELFWRTLSLRKPRARAIVWDEMSVHPDAALAAGLLRYDPAVARIVVQPVADNIRSMASGRTHSPFDIGTYLATVALIDPAWAVELIESLPDAADAEFTKPKNFSRYLAARWLSLTGPSRWQEALKRHLEELTVDPGEP